MSFWRNRPLIITIVLILILILLLFLTSGRAADGATSVIGRLIAPVQDGMYSAGEEISSFFQRIFASGDLAEENAQLREEIASLEGQLRDYNEVVAENQRLSELLNMRDTVSDYDVVTAKVIGKTPGQWFTEFTINVGSDDGIEKDMIVLTADGLMGRVVSVTNTYSRVSSFLDETSGVPCLIERTRDLSLIHISNGILDDFHCLNGGWAVEAGAGFDEIAATLHHDLRGDFNLLVRQEGRMDDDL